MALTWADTFGGGNSFTESFANTFTQNDGASYVDGTLTYDSGSNAGQVVQQNSSGGYGGTNDDGNAVYSGSANNVSTNSQNISGSGNNSFTPSGMAPSGISAALGYLNPLDIIGKLAGWANNLDPSKDSKKLVGNQQVYDNGQGFVYSYNFAKMPYEVEIVDGKVFDILSKDKAGRR